MPSLKSRVIMSGNKQVLIMMKLSKQATICTRALKRITYAVILMSLHVGSASASDTIDELAALKRQQVINNLKTKEQRRDVFKPRAVTPVVKVIYGTKNRMRAYIAFGEASLEVRERDLLPNNWVVTKIGDTFVKIARDQEVAVLDLVRPEIAPFQVTPVNSIR